LNDLTSAGVSFFPGCGVSEFSPRPPNPGPPRRPPGPPGPRFVPCWRRNSRAALRSSALRCLSPFRSNFFNNLVSRCIMPPGPPGPKPPGPNGGGGPSKPGGVSPGGKSSPAGGPASRCGVLSGVWARVEKVRPSATASSKEVSCGLWIFIKSILSSRFQFGSHGISPVQSRVAAVSRFAPLRGG